MLVLVLALDRGVEATDDRRLFSQGSRACRVGSQRINDAGRGNGARDVGEAQREERRRGGLKKDGGGGSNWQQSKQPM